MIDGAVVAVDPPDQLGRVRVGPTARRDRPRCATLRVIDAPDPTSAQGPARRATPDRASGSPDLLAPHGIDRAWLADVLDQAGVAPEAELTRVDATTIGTGQVGENLRCQLHWTGPGAGRAPASVVIKVPSASEVSRAAAAATRTYIKEVGFYRDLRPQVAIRTPIPYHVSEDRAANSFRLVLEDLAPARAGDQLTGCTLTEATLAVDAAADLHGSTWGRADLGDVDWLGHPTADGARQRADLYAAVLPGFLDRYAASLTPAELDLGPWLADLLHAAADATPLLPLCVTHGDFRPDNMLFGPDATLATVDWQTLALGQGTADLAYFLSGALDPAVRRAEERRLLDRYRQRLAVHGADVDADTLWHGYRAASPAGYLMAVIASQIVERTDRGDAMFVVMARGSARLMADLGVGPTHRP